MDTNTKEVSTKSDAVKFFSIFEVMKITGLSRVSVYRRIKDKTLKAIKLGRRVLISASFLDDLMAEERADLSKNGGEE